MTSINIVTPLWRRSAIGRVTLDLATTLARGNDVTIYAEPTKDPMPCPLPVRSVPPTSLDELTDCDRLITVLGNSALHGEALRVARSVSSIVVLHDVMLAGLFLATVPRPELREVLARYHGAEAADIALHSVGRGRSLWDGDRALEMPLFPAALERASGVVVHSQFAADLVRSSSIAPVRVIPLAFHSELDLDSHDARTPTSPYLLTLGHANVNKCHELVIDALATQELGQVTYVISGSITARRRSELVSRAAKSGVGERVLVTGQVSDEHLGALLRRAAVCVNLRRPTFESGSASLLEQMQARKPVVVLDHGCYSDLPDDSVVKLPVDVDAQGLARALQPYLDDETMRNALGERAAAYVAAHHSFDAYTDQLVDFFDEIDAAAPLTSFAQRVAGTARDWKTPAASNLPSRWAAEMSTLLNSPVPTEVP